MGVGLVVWKGKGRKEKGERRKEKGERRKEKGERRKEKGERRKEKGEEVHSLTLKKRPSGLQILKWPPPVGSQTQSSGNSMFFKFAEGTILISASAFSSGMFT